MNGHVPHNPYKCAINNKFEKDCAVGSFDFALKNMEGLATNFCKF